MGESKYYLNYKENRNQIRALNLEWDKSENEETRNRIEFKIKAIHYQLFNGKVINKESKEPISIEDEEFTDYLIDELATIDDCKLLLRHYILLWNSVKREFDYAKKAIDILIELIDKENGANETIVLLSNYIELSVSTKYKIDSLNDNLTSFYKNQRIESYSKLQSLPFILGNKYFKSPFLKSLKTDLEKSCDEYISKRRIFLVEELKELLIRYSSKIGEIPNSWLSRCAKIYENHADYRINDSRPLVSYQYYIKAKGIYHQAKNTEALNRVSKQIELLKKKKLLDGVSIPYENQEALLSISKYNIEKADELLSKSTKEILDYVVSNEELFPTLNSISLDPQTKFYRELVFGRIELDVNKNTFGRKNKSLIQLTFEEANTYKEKLRFTSLIFLIRLFYIGTLNGKLSSDKILNYLSNHTWFCKEFENTTSDGEIITYSWIELLKEQIEYLYTEISDNLINKESRKPKLVMLLDSLVLKFEGLLRQVLHHKNISTSKVVRGESREMILEDYLDISALDNIVPKNDLLLYYYLYTNQGLNLRNNISHSFFKTKRQYRYQDLILVFVSILKLGNINMDENLQITHDDDRITPAS